MIKIIIGFVRYEGKARIKKAEIRALFLGLEVQQSSSKEQRKTIIVSESATGAKPSFSKPSEVVK